MDNIKFNKNDITIRSACDIDSNLLIDFYKKAFPDRISFIESNWKWLNRSEFYNNKIPLVLIYHNQVIGHSGMIPFKVSICNESRIGSWEIDIKVLPEFQKHGLGSILIKERMNSFDCAFSFSNINSIGIKKKLGWIESFDSYMHLNFILPFNYPKFRKILPIFLCQALNFITYPVVLLIIFSRNSYSNKSYQLYKLTEKSFNEFYNNYCKNKYISDNTVSPIRDIEYTKWRILNSPNRNKYYIYKTNLFSAIILLCDNHIKHIDILWVSDNNNKIEINKMISTMGIYAVKNGFSYIRFYTSKKELSDYIRKKTKSIVRHHRFAYFSQEDSIFEKLKTANWDFELIDSDFEFV